MSDPQDFLKCPTCHRTTVTMTMHLDGDVSLECSWCDEMALATPLNESERCYQ